MYEQYGQPNNFEFVSRPQFPGMLAARVFAGTWLLLLGLLNLFFAIAVIAGSEIFITDAGWLIGDARPWGWLMLGVGTIQLLGGPAVMFGRRWGMWIGVASVVAHVVGQISVLSDTPALAIVLLGLDLTILACLWGTIGHRTRR